VDHTFEAVSRALDQGRLCGMDNTTRDRQVIDTPTEAQADETRTAGASRGATASSLANPRRVRRA
jgi:hypothetical protein